MRGQRSGVLTTRRMDETPAFMSVRAITPFAATMKFSISSLARFFLRDIDPLHLAVSNDRLRLHAVDVQRPQPLPLLEQALRRLILQLQLRRQISGGSHFRRSGRASFQPRSRRRCRSAAPDCAPAHDKCFAGCNRAIRSHHHVHHYRQPVGVLIQRSQIRR